MSATNTTTTAILPTVVPAESVPEVLAAAQIVNAENASKSSRKRKVKDDATAATVKKVKKATTATKEDQTQDGDAKPKKARSTFVSKENKELARLKSQETKDANKIELMKTQTAALKETLLKNQAEQKLLLKQIIIKEKQVFCISCSNSFISGCP